MVITLERNETIAPPIEFSFGWKKAPMEVFIDGPNFSHMQITNGRMVSFYELRQALRNVGKMVGKIKFYTCHPRTLREEDLARSLRMTGYEVITGKFGQDIDGEMRQGLLEAEEKTKVVAIFAGDGGYIWYIQQLLARGKEVIVFSSPESLNESYLSLPVTIINPFDEEWEVIYNDSYVVPSPKRRHVNKYR